MLERIYILEGAAEITQGGKRVGTLRERFGGNGTFEYRPEWSRKEPKECFPGRGG